MVGNVLAPANMRLACILKIFQFGHTAHCCRQKLPTNHLTNLPTASNFFLRFPQLTKGDCGEEKVTFRHGYDVQVASVMELIRQHSILNI